MVLVDVAVPAGVRPGELLEFEFNGALLSATVPEGLSEGASFVVEVATAAGGPEVVREPAPGEVEQQLQHYVDERAASGGLMDKFVAWVERENIEAAYEAFIAAHAAEMRGNGGVAGEQSHEWWPLYQAYQEEFEGLLQKFLVEAGCTEEEFVEAAQGASGMNEIYLRIFLAQTEYELFVEMMSQASSGGSG
ncbi:hypothetical protein AB1Y20_005038 [Prymnesium parvum]|uniref:BART domain-containing protein n=1 Tax=Prymnesium parvum TaxID=97485 RepID=A0AB34J2C4_PRYPA